MPLQYFSKQMDEVYGIDDSINGDYTDKGFMSDHYNSLMNNDHSPRFPVFGSDQEVRLIQCSESASTNDEAKQSNFSDVIKAKIASHPLYPKLLHAYIDCQKVGAPPEIAYILEEIIQEKDNSFKQDEAVSMGLGIDPELDQFMETYCEILVKYKTDLSRPFDEATSFLNTIENQLDNLCKDNGVLSSDDDEDLSGGEMKTENGELKETLLRKYGTHISSLKMEFSKKRKKGKLPKEARQMLLEWWNLHYKWPYPTESDKISLAEETGLDQKQINNWFINQRKRHWKPSDNMQLAIMNNLSGHLLLDDSLQE